jgi:site-specific DNA-methyltransferase (adenine-specific)
MPDDLVGVLTYGDTGGASRFFTVTEWDPTADAAPFRYVPKPSRAERNAGLADLPLRTGGTYEGNKDNGVPNKIGASPDVPVAPSANHHPTVKPLALMRWLVRLVTPPGGTVLEPFAGSGTTMAAAILEDRHVIGCELTADYLPIIKGRITWARRTRDAIPPTLFDQVQP